IHTIPTTTSSPPPPQKKSTRHKPTLISPQSQPYTSTPSQLHHLHAHVSLPKKIINKNSKAHISLLSLPLSLSLSFLLQGKIPT
ncbi:hypothetical protein COCVIDRAFT_83329, partial [Bipolaris victoriae FI3]